MSALMTARHRRATLGALAPCMLVGTVACGFSAPPILRSGGNDANAPLDAGILEDTGPGQGPDADITDVPGRFDGGVDSGVKDSGAADSGPKDMGFMDAAIPDVPMNQPDSGCPGVAVPAGDPAILGRVRVPHTIDRPVLIADLDGDQQEEIAVASANGNAISVIDYEACGEPVITTASGVAVGDDGLFRVFALGQPALAFIGDDAIRFLRYNPRTGLTNPGMVAWSEAAFGGGDPSGRYLAVTGENRDGQVGYVVWDANTNMTTESGLAESLLARPAYFAEGQDANSPTRFTGTDTLSALVLIPGTVPTFLPDSADVIPTGGTSVLQPGVLPAPFRVVLYPARTRSNRPQIRTTRVSADDTGIREAWGTGTAEPMVHPPILLTRPTTSSGDIARAYFIMENGAIDGCELTVNISGAAACVFTTLPAIGGHSIDEDDVSDSITLLSAYVNDNELPDIIVAKARGDVEFRTSNLGMQGAGTVSTLQPIAGTPGILLGFFTRVPGPGGDLMAVPHPDGAVTLIGWRGFASHGSSDRLWPQFRRDAARSGAL